MLPLERVQAAIVPIAVELSTMVEQRDGSKNSKVHICCDFSIVHLCLRPGDSVTIMLSHWHNLSMHTVENKTDMKP